MAHSGAYFGGLSQVFGSEDAVGEEPAQPTKPSETVQALSRGAPLEGLKAEAGGATQLLGAVSTLLALTPRGRSEELIRLTALAHGYIGLGSEDELVALAKAVANRDDVASSLADRLAQASKRAAETLIRANRLSDEGLAHLIETSDEAMCALIAGHHTLAAKHVTMLTASGSGPVLKALLANHQTEFSNGTKQLVEAMAPAANAYRPLQTPESNPLPAPVSRSVVSSDPKRVAQDFASLDGAGRRAVMRRLAEDTPREIGLARATRALDPTRHHADLAFLTVIEQRDPATLRDAFAEKLKLDPALVGKLLDEADGDAMIVLGKSAGLSSTAFARMLILGRTGLTGSPRDTFDLVDRFNALPQAIAEHIVSAMRGDTPPAEEPSNPTARRSFDAPSSAETKVELAQQGFRQVI